MTLVEILDVSSCKLDPELLWAATVDTPTTGSQSDIHAIKIAGWVLGRRVPATAVEVTDHDRLIRRVQVHMHSPGVAANYPQAPGSDSCGFWGFVGMVGIPLEFE